MAALRVAPARSRGAALRVVPSRGRSGVAGSGALLLAGWLRPEVLLLAGNLSVVIAPNLPAILSIVPTEFIVGALVFDSLGVRGCRL